MQTETPEKPKPRRRDVAIGCLIVAFALLSCCGIASALIGRASEKSEKAQTAVDAALTAKANAAVTPAQSESIDAIVAGDDFAMVNLRYTIDAIGGPTGKLGARKFAQSVAGRILASVPEIETVAVYDANDKVIDTYTRKTP